jgi:hypothetical protein
VTGKPPVPGIGEAVTIEVEDPTDPEAYVRAAYRAQASALIADMIYGQSAATVDEDGIHVAVEPGDLPDVEREVYGTSPVEAARDRMGADE